MKHLTFTHGVKCTNCGDLIVSKYRHDFHWCRCGATSVDGGLDYLRYGWDGKVTSAPKVVKVKIKWNARKKLYQFVDKRKPK